MGVKEEGKVKKFEGYDDTKGRNPKPVIVIGRQFGSGGRTIGKLISERLGIEYFDTRLLSKAAENMGLKTEVFKGYTACKI